MWIATTLGFFSIVQKRGDAQQGMLTLRARAAGDLDALRAAVLPELGPTVAGGGTDYPFRARAPRAAVARAVAGLIGSLDYGNFKDAVAARQGAGRAAVYHDVWQALLGLQDRSARAATADAFGGVLLRPGPEVLLREPKGHFDGTVWTFPKGRPDRGETPEACALREVLEETGHAARILAPLPGLFPGRTSTTAYFVMESAGAPQPFDASETQSIRWAWADDAASLIGLSPNPVARERDLAVLRAVLAWWKAHGADPGRHRAP